MEISQQEIIDMTNELYLRMSESILSEKEYGIMRKLLLEKQSISSLSAEYNMTEMEVKMIYRDIFFRMKSVLGKNELKDNLIALQEQKINFLEKELFLFKKEIQDMIQYYNDKTEENLNYSKKKDAPITFLGTKLK